MTTKTNDRRRLWVLRGRTIGRDEDDDDEGLEMLEPSKQGHQKFDALSRQFKCLVNRSQYINI
jgi:hypothetical protein